MKMTKLTGALALAILVSTATIFLLGADHPKKSDRVMSKTGMDIIDTAVAAGKFTTLAAALEAADLITPLKGEGPFTVFAPTDSAFAKLPAGTVENLLLPENNDQLGSILKHHVVSGKVFLKGRRLETLNGSKLRLGSIGDLMVNNAIVVAKNVPASNGVIHIIDTVMVPGVDEQRQTALKIISEAIELGVPLYNCQNEKACAAVYKSALESLMEFPLSVISSNSRKMIKDAFAKTANMHDADSKAWAFRNVLDAISAELEHGRILMTN